MADQPRYGEYQPSELFPDGASLQAPPIGTVAQDAPSRAATLADRPPMTAELLARGRERFGIYCTPCHGLTGDGDGVVPSRGFPHPPSYAEPRLVAPPLGLLRRRRHQRPRHHVSLCRPGFPCRPLGDRRLHPRAAGGASPARSRAWRRRIARTSPRRVHEPRGSGWSRPHRTRARCGGGRAPAAGLFAWLAATSFWAGIPLGALALLLVMRVLPGPWQVPLAPLAAALAVLLPLAAVAGLPVAFGFRILYPWVGAPLDTPFRAAWLAPAFWLARSGVFLAAGTAVAILLEVPGRRPLALAALIAFVPLHTVIAFDWLMSLDLDIHSSGFGLWMLAGQGLAAFAVIVLLRLAEGPRSVDPLGALFLVMLLLWAYAAFMPFFVAWSGNLPANAAWYGRRTAAAWAVVFPTVALLHAIPTLLLLLGRFRSSPRALKIFAALVLTWQALQGAWLVLPQGPSGPLSPLIFLGAVGGIGCLGLFALERRRRPVTP